MKFSKKSGLGVAICAAVVFFHGQSLAGSRPFECAVKGAPLFTARISNEQTNNRSLQVTFTKRATATVATNVVKTCVQLAVASDPKHDVLGSAWVGEDAIKLSGGGPYAYLAKSKSYKFITGL